MRIKKLSALVANQIAAGEVIERPASVVKELLENALDAGANAIGIEIGFGGINQIRIIDNGSGILAEDLSLAIEAHATSKIEEVSDLSNVKSMGFRGEALASIASVSKLSIHTKNSADEHATLFYADESGITQTISPRNQGTTIDVRDLFYNVPVRKQFLKSVKTEFLVIESLVRCFALSEPKIALTLKHNDKLILSLPAATCERSNQLRIKKLLGANFLDEAIYVDEHRDNVRIKGYICSPSYQRSQRDKQLVYINRRMIKDKLIQHAITKAYAEKIYPGRYPACLLYFTVPASEVDVNVHPTKHEVRFKDPRLIHDFILATILKNIEAPVLKEQLSIQTTGVISAFKPLPEIENSPTPVVLSLDVEKKGLAITHVVHKPQTKLFFNQKKSVFVGLNINFAVIFLDNNEPYLVDLKSVNQHRLKHLLVSQTLPLSSRPLLVPVGFNIDKHDYARFEQLQPELCELGLVFDFVSETRIVVRNIPIFLPMLDLGLFLKIIGGAYLSGLSQNELIETMVSCVTFDAMSIAEDEKNVLHDFIEQEHRAILKSYCVRLDMELCRKLLV